MYCISRDERTGNYVHNTWHTLKWSNLSTCAVSGITLLIDHCSHFDAVSLRWWKNNTGLMSQIKMYSCIWRITHSLCIQHLIFLYSTTGLRWAPVKCSYHWNSCMKAIFEDRVMCTTSRIAFVCLCVCGTCVCDVCVWREERWDRRDMITCPEMVKIKIWLQAMATLFDTNPPGFYIIM